MALIGLVTMSALQTGGWAQARGDSPIDLWRLIRTTLTAEKGDKYFERIKGSLIPPVFSSDGTPFGRIERKVVSQPSPKTLVVNVDDPAGDATLTFRNAKNVDPGTVVYFTGVVESCVKEPYMLVLAAIK
ncbi:MAG: hypothetical protein ABSB15_22340 [Bryobacteraceae bacterium]|jgi:hypothetical protein